MPEDDRANVERAKQGDREAMRLLFDRYRNMVYAIGLSHCGNANDADEVVQETFLRGFRRLSEWRAEGKLSSWLYTIASHVAIDWRNRSRRSLTPVPASEPDVVLIPEDETRQLLDAVHKLPIQQRQTLLLRYYKALSLAEIAELQGCAEGTVKANLHFAIVRLREWLAPHFKT